MRISPSASSEQLDDLHAALSNQYCYTIVAELVRRSETDTTLGDLATIVTEEHDVDGSEAEILLHHTALPKLDAVGLVDYDPQAKTVDYHGHPALVDTDAADTASTCDTQ